MPKGSDSKCWCSCVAEATVLQKVPNHFVVLGVWTAGWSQSCHVLHEPPCNKNLQGWQRLVFLLKTQLLSLLLQPANISGYGKGLYCLTPGRTPRRAARWDETPAMAPEPQWDFLVGRFWLLGDLSIYHRWDVAFEGEECNTSSLLFLSPLISSTEEFQASWLDPSGARGSSHPVRIYIIVFLPNSYLGSFCHDCGLHFAFRWISSLSGTPCPLRTCIRALRTFSWVFSQNLWDGDCLFLGIQLASLTHLP